MTEPGATRSSPAALPGTRTVSLGRELTDFWGGHRAPLSTGMLLAFVVTGVVGGGLLVGNRLGLGAAVVGLLVWAPAVRPLLRRRAAGDLVTAALSTSLLGVVAVRDAGWVVALCVAAAAGLGAVAATSARTAPAVLLSPFSWAAGAVRASRWVGSGAGTLAGSRRTQVLLAARSVGVTIALLLVFGLLFASADQVFASYLPEVHLDFLPAQVAVGALVALATATVTQLVLAPAPWSGVALPAGRPARLGEWLLPVLALDAMVVAFVALQVGALLGGHRHVLDTVGLSYAEYARQGFAQLVAATALTLVVVAVAARHAPRSTGRDRLLTGASLAVLCMATLGVVASALRRMDLYIEAFGLTRLRLFVQVVEVLLAVILVLVLISGLRWRTRWLPRAVVQVMAVAMLGLAAINPDAQIARHNTAAESGAPLDFSYVQGLSADAVPALDQLDEPLRSCLLALADVGPADGLAGWNLGRERALRVLDARAVIRPETGWPCESSATASSLPGAS